MRTLRFLGCALAAVAMAACSSSSNNSNNPPPYNGFVKPAGTIAVSFTVDDTANKVYASSDLKWKGSMLYDATTRKVTVDANWTGVAPGGGPLSGWAPLMDDGPWTASTTQHEPDGSVAGDHKFGVTVFVTPPATGSQTYEYGLIDTAYETQYGNGWIWPPGPNGQFVVNAGQTTDITAPGLVIPAFGTIDMKLTIDTNALDAAFTWDKSIVQVKGSAWAWGLVTLHDDGLNGDAVAGDGIYTAILSNYAGAGKQFPHTGLLKSGNTPEFIFTFNGRTSGTPDNDCCVAGPPTCNANPPTPPCEYKVAGQAATAGVAGFTKPVSGTFAPATVGIAGNGNTFITVP